MTVLSCSGLRRKFGDLVAVDDVSFEIAAGETYGLLGPNGAGKTTTISMVTGVLEPDAGEIVVDGVPMSTRAVNAKRAVQRDRGVERRAATATTVPSARIPVGSRDTR